MKIEFGSLFEVEILHDFFASGRAPCFRVQPTAPCRLELARLGLLFKETKMGFFVLYECEGDGAEKAHPKRSLSGASFSFIVTAIDPVVLNYSDLPMDSPTGSIYRFQNLQDNRQSGSLLLSVENTGPFVTAKDRLELRAGAFGVRLETAEAGLPLRVTGETGEVVLSREAQAVEGVIETWVDLSARPPGVYRLVVGGPERTFYASDELSGKTAFGVIDIASDSRVPPAYRFLDAQGDVAARRYTIRFGQRQTFWRYHVLLRSRPEVHPEDLSLMAPAITFNRETDYLRPDAVRVVPFVSTAAIVSKQESTKGVRLVKTGNRGGGSFELDNLPCPSVASVVPDTSAGRVYSDVYVYV